MRARPHPAETVSAQPMSSPARPIASGFVTSRSLPSKLRALLKSITPIRRFVVSFRISIDLALVSAPPEAIFLLHGYRFLKGVDVLAIAGSGQMNDEWGGAWSYPYTLLKWAVLARLAAAKCIAVSVGAGPIDAPLSKAFYRLFLDACSYRSVRDAYAQR
jgi:hypothetical protein